MKKSSLFHVKVYKIQGIKERAYGYMYDDLGIISRYFGSLEDKSHSTSLDVSVASTKKCIVQDRLTTEGTKTNRFISTWINSEALDRLPKVDNKLIETLLKKELEDSPFKFIVLDDDPTGVQTVHDISVYTDWSENSIQSGFAEKSRLFYILTNSRSMTSEQTEHVHREIATAVYRVSMQTGQKYQFISRSDSTLRGHWPLETEILKSMTEQEQKIYVDGEILCFFFKEGGRFTVHGVHYVKEKNKLIPVGETEFAKDVTFGYKSSSLPDYVEEKTDGICKAEDVILIPLEMLRGLEYGLIEEKLMAAKHFTRIVVDAADYCDLMVFCTACYRAMKKGKHFLFRSAASFVKVIGGITDRPLLKREEMIIRESHMGGIIVVGSHTKKTTDQLSELLNLGSVAGILFDSDLILKGDDAFEAEINRVVNLSSRLISGGTTVVCYTRRKLLKKEQDTKEEALLRSLKISEGVQSLVARLKAIPSFVVAKGGITSSDIGTKALGVRKATVLGQILPGIPVWKTDALSRFPGIPYVIFPGNVGETGTLRKVVEILEGWGGMKKSGVSGDQK